MPAGGVEIPASDYLLQAYSSTGGPPVSVNASCVGTGLITCTESSVPTGTWQYTDTPDLRGELGGYRERHERTGHSKHHCERERHLPGRRRNLWVRLELDDHRHGLGGNRR